MKTRDQLETADPLCVLGIPRDGCRVDRSCSAFRSFLIPGTWGLVIEACGLGDELGDIDGL